MMSAAWLAVAVNKTVAVAMRRIRLVDMNSLRLREKASAVEMRGSKAARMELILVSILLDL